MAKGTVTVTILGDARHLTRSLEDATRKFQRFGDRLTVGVTGPLALLGRTAVQAASDSAEAANKVGVVFGQAAASVNRFAENAARSIGQSTSEAQEAAASFGNMFNTVGFAADAAADMSVRMVQLASDMASFNNEDPSAMLERLQSGLAGQARPLRQFGVLLSEAEVNNKALALGLADSVSQISEADKVTARYNLILEQTEIQQGDFARTSDELANQQRILAASWDDARSELGENLLPIMKSVTETAIGMVEWFGNLDEGTQNVIVRVGLFAAALGPVISIGARLVRSLRELRTSLTLTGIATGTTAVGLVILAERFMAAQAAAEAYVESIRLEAGDSPVDELTALNEALTDQNRLLEQGVSLFKERALRSGIREVTRELEDAAAAGRVFSTHAEAYTFWLAEGVDHSTAFALASQEMAQRTEVMARNLERHTDLLPQFNELLSSAGVSMETFSTTSVEAAEASAEVTEKMEALRSKTRDVYDGVQTLSELLASLRGELSADQALIGVREQFAAVNEELRHGATELSVYTREGQENRRAIIDLIERHDRYLEVLEENGASTFRLAGEQRNFRDELAEVMAQAGFTEEQIAALNTEYNLAPEEISTAISTPGYDDAIVRIHNLQSEIEGIGDSVAGITARVGVEVRAALAGSTLAGGDGPGFGAGPPMPAFHATGDGPGFGGSPGQRVVTPDLEALITAQITDIQRMINLQSAAGVPAMMTALHQAFPGLQLISGYRPGARTATGNRSYHGMQGLSGPGRAVDLPPSMDVFNWIVGRYGSRSREVIFSPAGNRQIHNGRNHLYSGVTRANHWDHVHWAMANGGIVQATPGGVPVLAGEGGSDEAIIPLDRPLAVTWVGQNALNDLIEAGIDQVTDQTAAQTVADAITDAFNSNPNQVGPGVVDAMFPPPPFDVPQGSGTSRAFLEAELAQVNDDLADLNRDLSRALSQRNDLFGRLNQAEQRYLRDVARIQDQAAQQREQVLESRIRSLVALPGAGLGGGLGGLGAAGEDILPFLAAPGAATAAAATGGSVSLQDLQGQLSAANADLAEWITLLGDARAKGLSEDAIRLFGFDSGPAALEDLRAFSSATAAEIDEFNALVGERFRLAEQQTAIEQANLLGTVGEQLVAITAQTDAALLSLAESMDATVAAITSELDDLQDTISDLLAEISRLQRRRDQLERDTSRTPDRPPVVVSPRGEGSSAVEAARDIFGGFNVTVNSAPDPEATARTVVDSLRIWELARQ